MEEIGQRGVFSFQRHRQTPPLHPRSRVSTPNSDPGEATRSSYPTFERHRITTSLSTRPRGRRHRIGFFFFFVVVAVSMLSTVFLFSAARALLSAVQSTTSSQKRSSCNATDRKNRKQSYRGGEARERVSIFRVASSRKLERSKTTEMGRGFFSLCRFGRRPLSLRRFRFSLSKFFNRESLHWKRPRST